MWNITFFGLKSGQDLENRAAHPHQEFPGPRGRESDASANYSFIVSLTQPVSYSFAFVKLSILGR